VERHLVYDKATRAIKVPAARPIVEVDVPEGVPSPRDDVEFGKWRGKDNRPLPIAAKYGITFAFAMSFLLLSQQASLRQGESASDFNLPPSDGLLCF